MHLLGERGPLVEQGHTAGKVPRHWSRRPRATRASARRFGFPASRARCNASSASGMASASCPTPGEHPDPVGETVGQARRIREGPRNGQCLLNRLPPAWPQRRVCSHTVLRSSKMSISPRWSPALLHQRAGVLVGSGRLS